MADPKDSKEDKVAAAYENISKKLEDLRSGGKPDEDEEEENDESSSAKASADKEESGDEGLEEWKGPKGVKSEEGGEEEESEKDEEEPKSQKKWEPTEKDPLDEEDEKPEEQARLSSESSDPQPDTLDDLTEDDYYIPKLKGSRQEDTNIGYNTPSQKSSMETNDPNNFFSQHNQPQVPKRANKFHLLVLVVIGVVVIGFTVYILKGGFGEISINSKPSPSPSAAESPSPTPTPAPEPERSKYKIRVLNGSGKTGLAGSVSDKLKGLGYQVEKTGNATNSAFTQTVVRVKAEGESFIPQIVKDLAPDFDAAGNTSLKDADTIDIEIILGAK